MENIKKIINAKAAYRKKKFLGNMQDEDYLKRLSYDHTREVEDKRIRVD